MLCWSYLLQSHRMPRPAWKICLGCLCLLLVEAIAKVDLDERTRGYWKELTQICPSRNYTTCHGINRSSWTHAARSQFSNLTISGLGKWSAITLITFNHQGNRKTIGGDSWFLLFRDSLSIRRVPTRVFDKGDGSYEIMAHFLFPGIYSLTGWLYYSDCHGLQEPHETTENKMLGRNRLDVYYTKMLKKADHCWIGERIKKVGIVEIEATAQPPLCLSQSQCQELTLLQVDKGQPGPVWRMETYSHRVNSSIFLSPCCRPRLPAPTQPYQRLLFFGDSTVRNSWLMMMFMARRSCRPIFEPRRLFEPFEVSLCKAAPMSEVDPALDKILKRCTGGLPWTTVPVGSNNNDVSRHVQLPMGKAMTFDMANFTYNDTYARNHQPQVTFPLPREFSFIYLDGKGNWDGDDLWRESFEGKIKPHDVIIINLGSWYQRCDTFQEWQGVIDKLAVHLKRTINIIGTQVVWRTSFLAKEHVFRLYKHADGYVPQGHFQTDHRRILFESYAEDTFRSAGVLIWDIAGETAMGDYRPHDFVHCDGLAAWQQNVEMMDLFVCPVGS